jgi:hypothetical protein
MTRARVLGALAAVAVAACWLSAGPAPLADVIAVRGARTSGDFIRDYVTARARLEDGPGAPAEGERANDRAARLGAARVLLLGGPYYLRPPPALLAVLPIAWLPWHAAARVWLALSFVALIWLAISLLGLWAPGRRPRAGWVALLTAALALWPPALHCLEKGQWSIWMAALLAAGYRALERERPRRAGALFAVAAAVKATPIVLIGLLLARSRRAAGAMLATLAGIVLLALAVGGLAPWRAFVVDTPRDVAAWATWLANTASMQGVYARLFTYGPFTRPAVLAPLASRAAFAVTAIVLLAAAVIAGRGRVYARGRAGSGDRFGTVTGDRAASCWSAAWLALPVLLNPLGWSHVVVMLLAPLAVAFRDGGPRTRLAAALCLAALSIPRQRLMAWAGPTPVSPAPALVLGVHALAAIGVYLTLLAASRSRREPAAARPSPA